MRKSLLLLILIGIITLLYSNPAMASTVDFISNGDFSSGLTDWNVWAWNGDKATTFVNSTAGTLNWGASNATDFNSTGAQQFMSADVTGYQSLIVQCDIKPIYQSVSSPGSGDIFPIRIELEYIDTSDVTRLLQHGFYYSGSAGSAIPATFVTQGSWYTFTSANIMEHSNTPKTITKVNILGIGMDYQGSADNVKLLATPIPEPTSLCLFGLGLFGLNFIKRKRS